MREDIPAFPHQPTDSCGTPMHEGWPGMSLCDWFAGQALAGLLAAPDLNDEIKDAGNPGLARAAYELAGAMLATRALSQGAP